MKIVFTGGGTGGHFYPLIAVAEEINRYAHENHLVQPKKYYMGTEPYDEKSLYNTDMQYVFCPAGKLRRTKDIGSKVRNAFSAVATGFGFLKALMSLLVIFPDVIVSKGGYTSFPVLLAARLLRIPVVVHESDAKFGRVNKWSARFAAHIAVAYPEAERELGEGQKKKTALIGIPIRRQLLYNPNPDGYDILKLEKDIPIVAVLGGSSGAQYVNVNVLDMLPLALKKYQVVHVTGAQHHESVKQESESSLRGMKDIHTYHSFATLNAFHLRALYSVADIVITRAGSTTLFEVAAWGIPTIVVPIPEDVSHDQRANAYAYARSAGGVVVEQQNLNPNLLMAEIDKILSSESLRKTMRERAQAFAQPDASKKMARLVTGILRMHEV
ncbi:MAG: UDP-N-acetylglucosamine--N-acetylmuramyl-(pentapeptide) pyrophosphoryl-undecaprenol N-acetylglucosamine transferase [Candidatus Kaiserbacteria bacterium]|nr:UDP-N-acetylglucosamine--N-acetylmuramyl-(pentapeptide) pyrophosphoryl-undecaprenol N-acetylglucosamine transferase [Candidatus Kaiserbacteria bacterium]